MILYHKMKAMAQPRCMGLSHIQFCSIYILQRNRSHFLVKIPSADRILNRSQYYLVTGINCLNLSQLIDLKSTFPFNGWQFIWEPTPAGCTSLPLWMYFSWKLLCFSLISHTPLCQCTLILTYNISIFLFPFPPLFFPSLFLEEAFSSC